MQSKENEGMPEISNVSLFAPSRDVTEVMVQRDHSHIMSGWNISIFIKAANTRFLFKSISTPCRIRRRKWKNNLLKSHPRRRSKMKRWLLRRKRAGNRRQRRSWSEWCIIFKKESLGLLWYRQFFNPLVNFAGKHFELTFALGVHLQGALASLFLSDLERSAFGGRNNQHTLVGIGLAHWLADVDAILVGDVVIFLKFFVLEELFPYLSVEGRKLLVKFFLFLAQIINLLAHLDDFSLHFGVLPAPDPLDGIFV